MRDWLRKLAGRLRRADSDAELREEMLTHIQMKADADGDPESARRNFGNVTLLVEDSRAAWAWPRLEAALRDFRYGFRTMGRQPAFAATLILTLALGIGSASAIFSLIDSVLLRPLPYPDPGRLVAILERRPAETRMVAGVAPGPLEDLQRLNGSFEALAGRYDETFTETTGAEPERISAASVSPRFFSVFGVPAVLGRTFNPPEEIYGGPAAVVISHAFWQRRFGGDPGALGRSLVLEKQSRVIVGVMPPWFQYPSPKTEIWTPAQVPPLLMGIREAQFYEGIGRLKPAIGLGQAKADLDGVLNRLGRVYPKTDAGWTVDMRPLKDHMVGSVKGPLWLLFGSVSLLLLIACANVACLLLGQLNSRAAEIGTRCALGAGRAAIARQFMAEGLAYAAVGSALGVGMAFGGVGLIRSHLAELPRIAELAVDLRALAFAAAVTLLSLLLFSVAPMFHVLGRDPRAALTKGGRGVVSSGRRLQGLLVSSQLALATVLLIGSGLFLRSLLYLENTPLGFRPEHVLTLHVSASNHVGADDREDATAATIARHGRIMAALSAIPGVTGVAMASGLAGTGATWPTEFHIAGEPEPDGAKRFATQRVVTAGYFQTLAIPVLSGETCRMETGMQSPFSALVNRKFADRFLAGRDPIGHTVTESQLRVPMRIVGVVGDVREDGFAREPQPVIYACGFLRWWPDSDFLVQTLNPARIAGSVQQTVRGMEPGRAVYGVRPLTLSIDGTLSQNRFRTLLVGLFSALALLLAAVGLYGVMAYMVTQRTREIGIRVAMGARPGQVLSEILRSGGRLTAAGAVAGCALAAGMADLASTLLYGVRPLDGSTYCSATAVLFLVALLACLIPGRRAASIDPVTALRDS